MYTSFFNRESTSINIVIGIQGMINHNFFYTELANCDSRLSNEYKLAKLNIISLQLARVLDSESMHAFLPQAA